MSSPENSLNLAPCLHPVNKMLGSGFLMKVLEPQTHLERDDDDNNRKDLWTPFVTSQRSPKKCLDGSRFSGKDELMVISRWFTDRLETPIVTKKQFFS